ncbi:MAG: PLP-dependent cysteine synthase family protein, partial [Alphaproteobacteria bacterium]
AAESGGYWTDQLRNADPIPAYRAMGEEIRRQAGGPVDAFVHCVGTAASLLGVSDALRARDPGTRIVAVEPTESPVLSGGTPGGHRIDGVGAGFVVPLWHPGVADAIEHVSTAEATEMAGRLAREEGLFAGTSTGANLVAALRVAARLGPDRTVATIMCDTGMKYLAGR